MSPDTLPLAHRGFFLFPLPPGEKRTEPGQLARATNDAAEMARWPADANVGVACRPSGIVVLDLDRHDDGRDGIAMFGQLCGQHRRPWPGTLTVKTPREGLHLYFRAPSGVVVSSIGRWPGIDVRAPGRRLGGYVVGPGSIVGGREYVIEQDVPLLPLPVWLAALLADPEAAARADRPPVGTSRTTNARTGNRQAQKGTA